MVLPPSILENLSSYDVSWPLMFELTCKTSSRKTHCGVIEFTSDEGCAFIPQWIMEKLLMGQGEKILFRYLPLEKGSYVKLQPQTDDFLEISNPKAVLESKLRNFTCLTKDDVIAIDYNGKIFWLNILEVKPGNSISIIETDINLDFAPPVISKQKSISPQNKGTLPGKNFEKSKVKKEEKEDSSTEESSDKKNFRGQGFNVK